jgi:DNA-binding MarR family transcriptional regulator
MPDVSPAATLLFLREEELQQGLELLFFAHRDLDAEADRLLAARGLGRAHHRVLHFVGRQPQITSGDLRLILRLTKQSLSRLTRELAQQQLLVQKIGPNDRRQRLLSLTPAGRELERQLWETQRVRIARAYRDTGPQAVEAFRTVLLGMIEAAQDRDRFERNAPGLGRAR